MSRHFQETQLSLVAMVRNITTLRVMAQLLSGGHGLNLSSMDIHQEGLLRTRHTLNPLMVVTHSSHHQEVAWAGTRGRALRLTRVVVMTTTNRDLNLMKASHQTTPLDQVTSTAMAHHKLQAMDSLSIRSLHLHRTMALDMVILGTVLQLQPSSTMGSHQPVRSKATLNSQILMLDLHMVDLDNGHPEAVHLQMVLTRHHRLHLMLRQPSNLLLMVKHTQLDLMGMLSRVIHSRVGKGKGQQHMVRVLRQDQGTVNKAAMRSILHHSQHTVISQLKTMQTMVIREPQLIPTMEMPTHSQDMLLHRQLVSLDMVRQDTLSHQLQTHQVMISLRHQQLKVAMLHLLQTHSLRLQRACHLSLLLLLDTAGSGLPDFCSKALLTARYI
ncbi:unnamed protein product [Triticum turgidum subsp. durum]|uniref:Uncharacterized protein n=1 Tax=Triticum turgidum subsp. durum TaxID=4567 RepID=A0A9R1BQJ0_TRITD|nr:unnamed protein product [Triticum turgidum subsp. durum]